jgi:hypothetical protein
MEINKSHSPLRMHLAGPYQLGHTTLSQNTGEGMVPGAQGGWPAAIVTEQPQKWGVHLPRPYLGILDEARMRKHNTQAYNTMIFKL